MPDADDEAPRDIMEVLPEESTLPTAGSRIWGNWETVRMAVGSRLWSRSRLSSRSRR